MHSSTAALTFALRVFKELCLIVTNLQCLYERQNTLTQEGVLPGAVKVRVTVSSRINHLSNLYSMLMINHLNTHFFEALFTWQLLMIVRVLVFVFSTYLTSILFVKCSTLVMIRTKSNV